METSGRQSSSECEGEREREGEWEGQGERDRGRERVRGSRQIVQDPVEMASGERLNMNLDSNLKRAF